MIEPWSNRNSNSLCIPFWLWDAKNKLSNFLFFSSLPKRCDIILHIFVWAFGESECDLLNKARLMLLLFFKLSWDSRFQHAFTACFCVFRVITLVGSNQRNYFENANSCSKCMLKTTVATHFYSCKILVSSYPQYERDSIHFNG